MQNYSIPISIIIAGALIAGAVYFSNATPGAPKPRPVNINDVKIEANDPVIGEANAPATLAYWFDYQCPFCKAVDVGGVEGINFNSQRGDLAPAMPDLIRDYVDTGKLRIVFKDYAFLGPDSMTAALYKHAVWEMYPDKFYEWHEAMFHAQDEEHGGFGNEESILELIGTIEGLDADALKARVAEKNAEYTALILADQEEGAKFGINGTPGFITGKVLIPGAAGIEDFKAAIDPQL